ncbi:MAG: hypothetical protein II720_02160 [Bacteroidales bacterium]|nr:hypothetical protein [Bacteroidales bacterium]
MRKTILVILTGIIVSLFIFPFNLPFLSNVNTKMVIAAFGLVLFFLDMLRGRSFVISKDFLMFSLISILVSVWTYFVITINNTIDTSYAQYIVSAWVWMGGAYTVVWLIRAVHGEVSVELIGQYLIYVCVAQCLLAYTMTLHPPLKSFVDSLMGNAADFMGPAEGRIYGLGAALDPSGLRFAAVLVILAHLIHYTDSTTQRAREALYIVSFIIITVVGNMISRTTIIGVGIALLYWIVLFFIEKKEHYISGFWVTASISLLLSLALIVLLYRTNYSFRSNLRFGFEGFFSLVEKGYWETNSTNILKGMVVWPESIKTWAIGDGLFFNEEGTPDRFGQLETGFYMDTDIGYLRYIFYFGGIGLLLLTGVFVRITATCWRMFSRDRMLFLLILLVNMVGWVKVSSDIIMIFAPFFVLACLNEKEPTG